MTESQWKWADLLIKGFGVALVTAAVSFYSIKSEETQRQIAQQEQRYQDDLARQERQFNSRVQLASAQKDVDIDVGLKLLQAFVQDYMKPFSPNATDITETIVLLRMIAVNLQDVPINLKPLFEYLVAPGQHLEKQVQLRRGLDHDVDRGSADLHLPGSSVLNGPLQEPGTS